MTERIHKATLSQSQGREGWSVIFRHPVLLDRKTGKPGRRVRRGLGTKHEKYALKLIEALNELLADRTYWEASSREKALRRFPLTVVEIFYHDMLPERPDAFAIRDEFIRLPADSEYRQVLLLGTTGGGKTTLVRQLIGSDPETERFPSTSTAKTTVADTEIVLSPGLFRAAVTFLARNQVRDYVEECMSAAVLAANHGAGDPEVMRRLLNHADQRFRMSYILGTGASFVRDEEDFPDDEQFPELVNEHDGFDLTPTDELLQSSPQRLRTIAMAHASSVREELMASTTDERVFEELFEEALDNRVREDERFQSMADEFMDEIDRRFELLTSGTLETRLTWPSSWYYESEDRQAFLKILSRFSSNYAPHFGTLLTPLVSGIRVAGPFQPSWADLPPSLVLLDVEGLGHTPDSAASLPTAITRRLETVDAVLLVDNATQPMQAAPIAAMRNLASNGHADKLIVCFTHFDGVTGDNIPTFKLKQEHVLASAENALTSIGQQLGSFAERGLRKRLESACFFFGGLQQNLTAATNLEKRTVAQLQELLRVIDQIVEKPKQVTSRPVYDRMKLVLAVKKATDDFHTAWNAMLGLRTKPGVTKEHWSRVKGLTRRIGEGWDDEYQNLKPLADLHRELQENVYRFIQNPVAWTASVPSDDEKERIFAAFAKRMSLQLLAVVAVRLGNEVIQKWRAASHLAGKGSSFERAKMIAKDIYDSAAPALDAAPNPDSDKFLQDVLTAVRKAAEAHDIKLQ